MQQLQLHLPMLGSVALGEVGMVLSIEVARLSKTDKDWCHLLELCQVLGTLIADAEHIIRFGHDGRSTRPGHQGDIERRGIESSQK